ncbi:hypothetical protein A6J60_012745 [Psychrobacter sp. FDAARGOS_221]|nr:hypothetical protein A6J60_012745 [Psychrobacter sp. FDAARGOS_221]
MKKPAFTALMLSAVFMVSACSNNNDDSQSTGDNTNASDAQVAANQYDEVFAGCYTVSKDEPAQIKISTQDQGLVMQMKEPKSAGRVWDDPEPLEPIDLDQTEKYFSIDKNNLTAMIGRPDRVLVLGHIKSAYVNINPTLDSPYLGFILQGANTIYKVACDDNVNMDLVSEEDMSNITVKPIGKVDTE